MSLPDEKRLPERSPVADRSDKAPDRKGAEEQNADDDDLVDTMSEDSFPASDPPSHARPHRNAAAHPRTQSNSTPPEER